MSGNLERTCPTCGQPFSGAYTNKNGYTYQLSTIYCSKSCAASASKSISSDELRKETIDYISEQGRYCTAAEVRDGIGRSSKTFSKHGVSVRSVNQDLGFDKPKSCFQKKVQDILEKAFEDVENEKSFDGLVGNKGHSLRVDFYIPSKSVAIEADGSQHKYADHPWAKWNNGTVEEYDDIKDKYCQENGIRMVRIPYKRNLKPDDVLSKLPDV